MVNMNNDENEVDVEITNEETTEIDEPELIDIEEKSSDKLKRMREKLAHCEEEKKKILDDSQRAKADFLNARKRLENERELDKVRYRKKHVLELLPLCDSFQMAMSNTEAWEKADESWRKGVEGIHTQLLRILESYEVSAVDPTGQKFNPHQHEAIGTEVVEDEAKVDTVISVVQRGYIMKDGQTEETIRPARVTTGIIKE
ncbi:nucleotide exchange factor GrpE [Candidatus Kaiserbacteria bacterium]|nr:nucleotide exchange factor GrpE [Candidatus Kaiserbacteria bacterium]